MSDPRVLRGAWSRRHLVLALTYRSFQVRYRQSMIGIVWAFIPLVGTLFVADLVFSKIAGVGTGGLKYPLFALSALLPWSFFSGAVTSGVGSIAGSGMVTKLAFPRATLPFFQVGTALMNLVVSIVVFLGYMLITLTPLHLTALWFFPLFALELVLISGIILLGSAMNAFARDVNIILGSVMPLWLLLTPILYDPDKQEAPLKGLHWIYTINPMTGLVLSFRNVLGYGKAPAFGQLIPTVIESFVLLAWGVWYFGATQDRFSDVV
jgi:lipopolysaccharide transport system permease protein